MDGVLCTDFQITCRIVDIRKKTMSKCFTEMGKSHWNQLILKMDHHPDFTIFCKKVDSNLTIECEGREAIDFLTNDLRSIFEDMCELAIYSPNYREKFDNLVVSDLPYSFDEINYIVCAEIVKNMAFSFSLCFFLNGKEKAVKEIIKSFGDPFTTQII